MHYAKFKDLARFVAEKLREVLRGLRSVCDGALAFAAVPSHWKAGALLRPKYRSNPSWLYLAVVIDLFLRQVVGWSMRPTLHSDVVMQAILAAAWRRKPPPGLMLHSDQGCQFIGGE